MKEKTKKEERHGKGRDRKGYISYERQKGRDVIKDEVEEKERGKG